MRVCKDCVAEGVTQTRPAPFPGPRCATHHRRVVNARKSRAHDLSVQRTYGLPPGGYELVLTAQGGKCWICRRATGRTKRLAVDHDHATGKVRGILCGPCNSLLAHVRDEVDVLLRAVEYLRDPPAQRLLPQLEE